MWILSLCFFFQAEDGIRDLIVTGVQTCALPILLLGDIFARRGLHGEALERYREARGLAPDRPNARLGEVKALFALGRTAEAAALAEELLPLAPDDVEALVVAARGRAAAGDAAGALTALRQAQTRAPDRADLHKLQGDVALKVGDKGGALAAYRGALELDPGYVQVWVDLGRLHEEREEWREAQEADERGPEGLPPPSDANPPPAGLFRRPGQAPPAIPRPPPAPEQEPHYPPAPPLPGR